MSSDQYGDAEVRRTTDHGLIRGVIEERGGYPAHEPRTEGQGDRGLLRIGRRGRDEDLKELSWEAFFEEFDGKDLVFVYPADSAAGSGGDGEPVGTLEKRSAADQ